MFKDLNAKGVPDNAILLSSNIASMFPSIHNNEGKAGVIDDLNSRSNL